MNNTGLFITVLAMDKYEGSKNIKVGDILCLIKEPHPKDENAIKVTLDNESKEQIGYIANSKGNTVIKTTLSASEIHNKINNKSKVEIIELKEDRGFMKLYKGKVVLESAKKPITDISFKLTGAFSTHGNKRKLSEDVKVSPRQIKIIKENKKLIGEYEGLSAGVVTCNEENMEIITQYVEDLSEVIATANSTNNGVIICNLKLKEKIKTNRVKVEEIVEKIIAEGINTKAQIEEKLEYLRRCKVTEIAIGNLFSSYIKYPENVKNRIPEKPKVLYVDTEGLVNDAICYMNKGKNLLFEGDKAVGKNVLTETLAWLYNRPLYEFSSNSQHSNNSLLGSQTFESSKSDNEEEKKNTAKSFVSLTKIVKNIFTKGEKADIDEKELTGITKIIYKALNKSDKNLVFDKSAILEAFVNGGIVVLDEFNTSLPHVMPIFNALLDDRRRMDVTNYGLALGHPNFCAIATQNRDYEGTFDGNEATFDRFEPILFPALNSIADVLRERVPNASYETISIANKLYLNIKSSVEIEEMSSQALSLRGFVSACEVIEEGMPLERALKVSVADRITDLDERKAVENMIDLLIG